MIEPRRLGALSAVIVLLSRVKDPVERMRAICAVSAELDVSNDALRRLRRATAIELRQGPPKRTWREIGELLDVSAQAAYQLVHGQASNGHRHAGPPITVRMTPDHILHNQQPTEGQPQ